MIKSSDINEGNVNTKIKFTLQDYLYTRFNNNRNFNLLNKMMDVVKERLEVCSFISHDLDLEIVKSLLNKDPKSAYFEKKIPIAILSDNIRKDENLNDIVEIHRKFVKTKKI